MDDYDDHSDYGDYESGGDDFDEEDYCDDDLSGGEDDGEEEEEVEEEEEEEEEGAGNEMEDYEEEEEEGAGDEMEDYEEEEEIAEYSEENDDHAEVVEDQAGVEVEDEIEEDLVEYEEEEEEEEEEPMEDDEDEEELLEEEDEDEAYGDVGSNEDDSDYEDEIAAAEPFYLPRPRALAPFPTTSSPFLSVADVSRLRSPYIESGLSDLSGDGSGLGSSRSNWRRSQSGDGTASSRSIMNNVIPSDGNVVESRGTESSGSNDSNLSGLKGTICSICYECWTGEGEHCVCCLPCGHLYGLSCIKMWLQQPNSQKCPQCNKACELADVRRLYGMQLAITGVEELQQKVKCLEAQCASLVLKDADWLRKEAEWQKKEADLQHQLNQHKEPETGLVKPAMIPGEEARKIHDPVDDPEPANALRHMKL